MSRIDDLEALKAWLTQNEGWHREVDVWRRAGQPRGLTFQQTRADLLLLTRQGRVERQKGVGSTWGWSARISPAKT